MRCYFSAFSEQLGSLQYGEHEIIFISSLQYGEHEIIFISHYFVYSLLVLPHY